MYSETMGQPAREIAAPHDGLLAWALNLRLCLKQYEETKDPSYLPTIRHFARAIARQLAIMGVPRV